MQLPTDIKDAADYLEQTFMEAATLRGADLSDLRKRADGIRPDLLRLARNDYQAELVNSAVSAVVAYMNRGNINDQSRRQSALMALDRLRKAPTFGPSAGAAR